ncbi:MAG: glycosyltransferase [Bacteroidales bacterium]|nr:glycosyltransferase [Bacteroidales bacterium]
MRILVLTNKLPYPPFDGGSIATLNMITGLRDAGNQVTCLSLNTSKHPFPVYEIPEPLSGSIRFIGIDCDCSIRPIQMLFNLLFSGKPYIAERFHIREYRMRLMQLLQTEDFDLVQLEGPYMGHYLDTIRKWSKSPVSLRAHNVEHLIWKRKAENETNFLKRWYLGNMAARLERFEKQVARETDCLVAISPIDETYFRNEGYDGATITIPTGISLEQYPATPLPETPTLFFIGALDWLPNQEAISWFLDNVFERLVAAIPHLEFHIAGRNAPEQFIRSLRHQRITYHGEVEDAKAFMSSYRVMVAPLLTGSGIRIKILEGMALGRPVVTTTIGMEGIPAENNRDLLAGDEPDLFKDHVVKLINSNQEAIRMTAAARQLIKENFDTFGLSTRLSQFFMEQV